MDIKKFRDKAVEMIMEFLPNLVAGIIVAISIFTLIKFVKFCWFL